MSQVVASGHTIIKHILAKHGPQTTQSLFDKAVTYAPLSDLTRSKFKKYFVKALKGRHEILTKIDRTQTHAKYPNQFEFTHRLDPRLQEFFAAEKVLYQRSHDLVTAKEKELAAARAFWVGETNTPHIPKLEPRSPKPEKLVKPQ
ncbi:hypothetical protein H4R33_001461 [Dimargaris cristalligena]|nr:hypothetical protein H4R33_001461 [Dimargaris cristalligena]